MATKQQLHVLVFDRDEGSNAEIKDILAEMGLSLGMNVDPRKMKARSA